MSLAQECTDPDDGKDYQEKGNTFGVNVFDNARDPDAAAKNHIDRCYDSERIQEYFCNDEGLVDWIDYSCPFGCMDGVCLEEPLECTDSDDGINYDVKGTTIGINVFDYSHSDQPSSKSHVDRCDGDKLQEYYCNNDNLVDWNNYECPISCRDGVCLRESEEETEIDQESMSIKTLESAYNVDEIITGRDATDSDKMIRVHTKLPQRMDCDQSYVSFTGQEIRTGSGGCLIDGVSFSDNPSRLGVGEWKAKIIATSPETGESFTIISPPFIIYSKSTCTETDGGQNYYAKGLTIDNKARKALDSCKTSDYLLEAYCEPDNTIGRVEYECPKGCEDAACLPFYDEGEVIEVSEEEEILESSKKCPPKTCKIDSEECIGENKIIVEECNIYIKSFDDKACNEIKVTNSKILRGACRLEKKKIPQIILCQGCQIDKNTCIPFGTRLERKDIAYYCDISKEMTKQKENGNSCQNSYECTSNNCKDSICSPICSGCFDKNNNCLPYGTRTSTEFCNIDGKLADQKNEEQSCNNNYECSSNVCVNNECISQNFIQKIINWFRKLFGG